MDECLLSTDVHRLQSAIQRFGSTLVSRKQFDGYMSLPKGAHRDDNLAGVMCKTLISVSWQGHVHDCDFNQMLGLPLGRGAVPVHLADLLDVDFEHTPIHVASHRLNFSSRKTNHA